MSEDYGSTIVYAQFETPYGAPEALKRLQGHEYAKLFEPENAAVIVKDDDGKVAFSETADSGGGKGMRKGAAVGGLLGLIFPPSLLATALAGGALGGIASKARDAGFDDGDLRAIAGTLPNNSSVLVAVVGDQWVKPAVEALSREATVHTKPLTGDMKRALESW